MSSRQGIIGFYWECMKNLSPNEETIENGQQKVEWKKEMKKKKKRKKERRNMEVEG